MKEALNILVHDKSLLLHFQDGAQLVVITDAASLLQSISSDFPESYHDNRMSASYGNYIRKTFDVKTTMIWTPSRMTVTPVQPQIGDFHSLWALQG